MSNIKQTQAGLGNEPGRWRLREALSEKKGLSDAAIEELYDMADRLDLVEMARAVEEEFGIEIQDGALDDSGDSSKDGLKS